MALWCSHISSRGHFNGFGFKTDQSQYLFTRHKYNWSPDLNAYLLTLWDPPSSYIYFRYHFKYKFINETKSVFLVLNVGLPLMGAAMFTLLAVSTTKHKHKSIFKKTQANQTIQYNNKPHIPNIDTTTSCICNPSVHIEWISMEKCTGTQFLDERNYKDPQLHLQTQIDKCLGIKR